MGRYRCTPHGKQRWLFLSKSLPRNGYQEINCLNYNFIKFLTSCVTTSTACLDYLLASGGVLGLDRGLLVGWGLAGVAATVGWSIAISALIMLVLLVIGKLRFLYKIM